MSGTKGMTHYEITVKQEAVRLFLEEGYTYRQIAEEKGIRKADRIKVWVKQYRREGEESFTKPIGRRRKGQSEQAYVARLEMENKLLKKLRSELCKNTLAKRNIGQLITTRESTR
jgi:transposase